MGEEHPFPEKEDDDSSYSFMNETVKKRPPRYKKILMRIAQLLLSGLLFGAAAAFVFLRLAGDHFLESGSSQVVIEQDVDSSQSISASEEETSTGSDSEEPASETEKTEESAEESVDSAGDASDSSQGVSETQTDSEESESTAGSEEERGDGTPADFPDADSQTGSEESSGEQVDSGDPDSAEESLPVKTEEELQAEALEQYTHLHTVMRNISDEAGRALIQVTGVTDTEDWFNNISTSLQTASGLIVAKSGESALILCDGTTIIDAQRILVTLPDATIVDAQIRGTDPITGLCVIAISTEELPDDTKASIKTAPLGNSFDVRTGDSVIAIGSPLGYSNSVVYGEITSVGSHVSVIDGEYELFTTNCIGSASGSGVLVDLEGNVIGCIFQRYAREDAQVVTAIPISLLKGLIESLSNNEGIRYLGLTGEGVSEEIAEGTGIPTGVYITGVEPDSPALTAGLLPGDVIRMIDGQQIFSMTMLHNKLSNVEIGATMKVTAMRNGAEGFVEFETEITVGELK